MRQALLAAALLLSVVGCARDKTANQASAGSEADRATTAAAIANAMAAKPASADSILTANGYTAESFERLMYENASDSAMSVAYANAKK
jgi:prophage DNA circulation protein